MLQEIKVFLMLFQSLKIMYKLEDIRDIHLEVTTKCQAKCPMCPRRINGGLLNPLMKIAEIDIDTFKKWFPQTFVKQLNSLFMCGNLGDPIIARDCLEIFEYLKETNPNIKLTMHTNGSARDTAWWTQLANSKVRVVFGLDGLEDTHHLYRIATDWNKIIENAKAYIDAGGHAEWHMLVFQHNEHQIDECRELSQQLGFSHFQIKHTTRFEKGKFHVLDEQGKTINILYPTEKSKEMSAKVLNYITDMQPTISCKAQKNKQFYISADGNISPCCWLDFSWILPRQDSRVDYMDRISQLPNLYENSLEEIFNSGHFDKIAETWNKNPLLECSKQCGSFDKSGAQFV
jgi:MoaA/NifB/PqqE/SkfB family radical SAM enzyme